MTQFLIDSAWFAAGWIFGTYLGKWWVRPTIQEIRSRREEKKVTERFPPRGTDV